VPTVGELLARPFPGRKRRAQCAANALTHPSPDDQRTLAPAIPFSSAPNPYLSGGRLRGKRTEPHRKEGNLSVIHLRAAAAISARFVIVGIGANGLDMGWRRE
jgi:hypothetical protein